MIKPTQLIIIGNGTSLNEGLERGLINKLSKKFHIIMNFSYEYFQEATVLCFVDPEFYLGLKRKWQDTEDRRLKHLENIKKFPLILGRNCPDIKQIYPNTILFNSSEKYQGRKSIECNLIHRGNLCGLFTLTLGICLLDVGEIFILGFDSGPLGWVNRIAPYNHFTQKRPNAIKHRGFRQIAYYEDRHEKRDYEVYKGDPKIKIYNVSLNSNIPEDIFPKISYDKFFEMLDDNQYNQQDLRTLVKNNINALKKG